MDIQKEREAFEQWHFKEHYVSDADKSMLYEKFKGGSEYVSYEAQYAWKAWQAAKAQAVPEGFVLVPREPTEEMLGAAWEAPPAGGPSGNRRVFYEKQAVVYKAMVEEAEKAMIEAQEQKG